MFNSGLTFIHVYRYTDQLILHVVLMKINTRMYNSIHYYLVLFIDVWQINYYISRRMFVRDMATCGYC